MDKIKKIIKEILVEKKIKRDRCLRIADRKFKKHGAYKSGAVVRCRKGKIWKGLKEADDLTIKNSYIDEDGELDFKQIENDLIKIKPYYKSLLPNYLNNTPLTDNQINQLIELFTDNETDIFDANWMTDADKIKFNQRWRKADIDDLSNWFVGFVEGLSDNWEEYPLTEDESLHKWFKRRGPKGKEGGWIDCNAPDGEGGYKPCGRKKGEKRAEYPSCRPTPAKCKTKGKGKKWGKTKLKEITVNQPTTLSPKLTQKIEKIVLDYLTDEITYAYSIDPSSFDYFYNEGRQFIIDNMVYNNHEILRNGKEILVSYNNEKMITDNDIEDYIYDNTKLKKYIIKLIIKFYHNIVTSEYNLLRFVLNEYKKDKKFFMIDDNDEYIELEIKQILEDNEDKWMFDYIIYDFETELNDYLTKEFLKSDIINEITINKPSLIFGITHDGERLNFELDKYLTLDVRNESLKSLTVRDKRIKGLYCADNNLTSLDIRGLTKLEVLKCYNNYLTSLDVKGLTNLKKLDCTDNDLTSLDVNGLTNLKELYCSANDLTSLDVKGLTNLKELSCSYTNLTSLDVNGLTNLEYLDCSDNNLTSLNVQGCVNLEYLYCYNNDLTSLDIRGLTKLNTLSYDKDKIKLIGKLNEITVNNPSEIKFPLLVTPKTWPSISKRLEQQGYIFPSGFLPTEKIMRDNIKSWLIDDYGNKMIMVTKIDGYHIDEITVNPPIVDKFPIEITRDNFNQIAQFLEKKGYKWRDNVNVNSLTQFNPFKDSIAQVRAKEKLYLYNEPNSKKIFTRTGKLNEITVNQPGFVFTNFKPVVGITKIETDFFTSDFIVELVDLGSYYTFMPYNDQKFVVLIPKNYIEKTDKTGDATEEYIKASIRQIKDLISKNKTYKVIPVINEITVNQPFSLSLAKKFKDKYINTHPTTLLDMLAKNIPDEFIDKAYDYIDNIPDYHFEDQFKLYQITDKLLDFVIELAKQGDEASLKYIKGELP